ncbi:MAG: quinolinate synthase NadA [Gammaproteobacteria bacterium]|nr:quinolinate synthase NadA [Gammaproteobacteria bacterium]MDH5275918.1 quinolinate synthase NadA [Gammaproteobacteria bacterium]
MTVPTTDLAFTPEIARETRDLYQRVRHVIPDVEWPVHAPLIAAINRLKTERQATILVHNYMSPQIFHGVADFSGDSLGLAQFGARTDATTIVMCGVHFMAETAKILSPQKTVLLPDLKAGCSLASSITAADVRALRERHPGVPVVTYVNTSADVKAESDVCCTSANAVQVVESLGVEEVIFIPDQYLGKYVAGLTDVRLILWEGACEVHERFTGPELHEFRGMHPGIHVMAHPECPPDVLAEADYVGSTSAMIEHVGKLKPRQVAMITECSMAGNVAVEFPEVEFIQPCNLCPHMQRITLPKILHALQAMSPVIDVPADTARRARQSLERMLAVGRGAARD